MDVSWSFRVSDLPVALSFVLIKLKEESGSFGQLLRRLLVKRKALLLADFFLEVGELQLLFDQLPDFELGFQHLWVIAVLRLRDFCWLSIFLLSKKSLLS